MIDLLPIILVNERCYRYEKGIGPVLGKEVSLVLDNDFVDCGLLVERPCICVRGSDDIEDWRKNLFLDFSTELHAQILNWIVYNGHTHKNILLTGHSRGGAIAQHIAKYLRQLQIDCEAVTFGAPRIKNPKSHAGLYKHTRVTNGADGVPRLPPKFYAWNYGHHGEHIELDRASLWRKSLLIIGILTRHFIHDYKESYLRLQNEIK